MRRAEASLAPEYRDAVAALERTVAGQLGEELASTNDRPAGRADLAEELRRRRDDYRTWYRMGEVPQRVAAIAARLTRGEPAPALRRQLELAVLDAMVRAHERALGEDGMADGAGMHRGAAAGGAPGSGQGQ